MIQYLLLLSLQMPALVLKNNKETYNLHAVVSIIEILFFSLMISSNSLASIENKI